MEIGVDDNHEESGIVFVEKDKSNLSDQSLSLLRSEFREGS
jgi:hypothetical protein